MNRYHQTLNIPEYFPSVDFTQWNTNGCEWKDFHQILKFDDLNNHKIKPWLNSLGLTSNWIEVFYTPPFSKGIIHSDNSLYLDWSKILFQFGAPQSSMRWWSSNKTTIVSNNVDEDTDSLLIANENDCVLEHEVFIKTVGLINAGPLHSSYNPTTESRFVVTIALFDMNYKRILWDDAVNILSPYIVC